MDRHETREMLELLREIRDLLRAPVPPAIPQLPYVYDPSRCIFCGGDHHGSNMPCPSLAPISVSR